MTVAGWIRGGALVVVAASCATGPTVTRVADDANTDLSGYWNDTDSRQVAAEMVSDLVAQAWLKRHVTRTRTPPRVVVGKVRNRTTEHIPVEALVRDLERELTNSGKVRFVADRADREFIRQERFEQSEHASEETVKDPDAEHAADVVLQGTLNSIVDASGGTQVRWYQINMELLDIVTLEKLWIGQTRIKKIVERDAYTF